MIDLNEKSFDGGGKVFNNNKAGVVENVTLSIERKKPEDKEKAPDYKLIFTDTSGATVNLAYWFITADTQYKTIAQQTQAQGKMMKHLLHAIYGETYEFPKFKDTNDMLNGCMKLIREGLVSGLKFRIFVNFGTTSSVKTFVQPRSWVPMLESMTVPMSETRLSASALDAMSQLVEDNIPMGNADDLTAKSVNDDWE